MKTVQKITNYTFLKTCEGRKDYSFIRVQVEGLDRFTWIMGKENENGLISSVGYINDELQNSLEKEYRDCFAEECKNHKDFLGLPTLK